MNILLVTMSMDIGGAETHILELAKELKKRGNNVYVASAGGKLVEELSKFEIEHIYSPLKDKKINHIFTSLKIIKEIIKNKNIEIVHAHARIPGAICGIACKKSNTPFVTTVHGMFRVNLILKLLTNWGEKTLAVSEDIKEQVITDYKLKAEDVGVTVNGIDVNKFKKDESIKKQLKMELKIEENTKILMHVSRLDRESSSIAEKLINLSSRLKNDNIKVVLVGSGDKFKELESTAKKNDVLMLGARTDVDKVLNIADIFVGVSRAAMEAMSTEIPVILAGNESYKQGYQGIFEENKVEEALKTNFCCRQMPVVEEEILYKDIIKLIHTENIGKIGKYNREFIKKYYSIEKMSDDCEKMYKSVINKK